MKLNEIRWGIIGVGDVCEVKSAPAMQLIDHSEVVAVMRRNTAKAEDYANRHGIDTWYDKGEKLIHDPRVNAIYIATPPNARVEYCRQAAAEGKAIYVEKPMARTHAECREMLEIVEKYEVPLFVAYYRRSLPNFLKIKSLLADGAIGDVRQVQINLAQSPQNDIVAESEINWRVDPSVAGGGYFYDLGSHQLDLLDYLFGPIKNVYGHARNQGNLYAAEDMVTANFSFEHDILGVGSWCFTAHDSAAQEMTTIVGSKGKISFQTFGSSQVVLENDNGKQQFDFTMPKHIQQPLIQTVVDELRGVGKCPSTGLSAARTNWVMEKIVYS